jgi:hypothetical protein
LAGCNRERDLESCAELAQIIASLHPPAKKVDDRQTRDHRRRLVLVSLLFAWFVPSGKPSGTAQDDERA